MMALGLARRKGEAPLLIVPAWGFYAAVLGALGSVVVYVLLFVAAMTAVHPSVLREWVRGLMEAGALGALSLAGAYLRRRGRVYFPEDLEDTGLLAAGSALAIEAEGTRRPMAALNPRAPWVPSPRRRSAEAGRGVALVAGGAGLAYALGGPLLSGVFALLAFFFAIVGSETARKSPG